MMGCIYALTSLAGSFVMGAWYGKRKQPGQGVLKTFKDMYDDAMALATPPSCRSDTQDIRPVEQP